MSYFVQNNLSGLKKLLNKNDQMKTILHEGEVQNVSYSFNAPVQTAEIKKFESKNNIKLPKDYKAFLTLHNGAKIYDLIDDDGLI